MQRSHNLRRGDNVDSHDELLTGVLNDIKAELARVRTSVHDLRESVNTQIGQTALAQAKAAGSLALMQKDIDHLGERLDQNQKEMAYKFEQAQAGFDNKFAAHCKVIDQKFADMKIVRRDWIGWLVALGITALNLGARLLGH